MKELDKYESSVLTMMQMKDCRPSTSPKLEKQTEPGNDDPCEQSELLPISSVHNPLSDEAHVRFAGPRWLCERLRDPN